MTSAGGGSKRWIGVVDRKSAPASYSSVLSQGNLDENSGAIYNDDPGEGGGVSDVRR